MSEAQVDPRLTAWLGRQVQVEQILSRRDQATRRVRVGTQRYCHKHAPVRPGAGGREAASLLRERDALSALSLRGRRITAPSFAFQSDDDGADLLIQWVQGPSLGGVLAPVFTEGDAALITRAWHAGLDALEVLHGAGLVHGDLQPGHLVFGRDERECLSTTLLDLGCTDDPGTAYHGGLMHFMHPQVARALQRGQATELTAGVDLHALVASFLLVLTGAALYPFDPAEPPSPQRWSRRLAAVANGDFIAAPPRGTGAADATERLFAALRSELPDYSIAGLREVL